MSKSKKPIPQPWPFPAVIIGGKTLRTVVKKQRRVKHKPSQYEDALL